MPKTYSYKPRFAGVVSSDSWAITMRVVIVDSTTGKPRGDAFTFSVAINGSASSGPDGIVIESPASPALLNATIGGGPGPIQTVIDGWDAAGKLDAYY